MKSQCHEYKNHNDIIHKLPRELQIHCLQFLTTPNERIIVIGSKNVGKTTCINQLMQNTHSHKYNPITDINTRVKIAELNDANNYNFLKKPTNIIVICDVISSVSMHNIYNNFIPKYVHLNVPFTIIINNTTDADISKWQMHEIKILIKQKQFFEKQLKSKIPIHWISSNMPFPSRDFEYIMNKYGYDY